MFQSFQKECFQKEWLKVDDRVPQPLHPQWNLNDHEIGDGVVVEPYHLLSVIAT
jgi:hypothetical protein